MNKKTSKTSAVNIVNSVSQKNRKMDVSPSKRNISRSNASNTQKAAQETILKQKIVTPKTAENKIEDEKKLVEKIIQSAKQAAIRQTPPPFNDTTNSSPATSLNCTTSKKTMIKSNNISLPDPTDAKTTTYCTITATASTSDHQDLSNNNFDQWNHPKARVGGFFFNSVNSYQDKSAEVIDNLLEAQDTIRSNMTLMMQSNYNTLSDVYATYTDMLQTETADKTDSTSGNTLHWRRVQSAYSDNLSIVGKASYSNLQEVMGVLFPFFKGQ